MSPLGSVVSLLLPRPRFGFRNVVGRFLGRGNCKDLGVLCFIVKAVLWCDVLIVVNLLSYCETPSSCCDVVVGNFVSRIPAVWYHVIKCFSYLYRREMSRLCQVVVPVTSSVYHVSSARPPVIFLLRLFPVGLPCLCLLPVSIHLLHPVQ